MLEINASPSEGLIMCPYPPPWEDDGLWMHVQPLDPLPPPPPLVERPPSVLIRTEPGLEGPLMPNELESLERVLGPGIDIESVVTQAPGFNPVLEHAYNNTVLIGLEIDGKVAVLGSGFFTDGGTVATAEHVVRGTVIEALQVGGDVRIVISPFGGPQAGEMLEVGQLSLLGGTLDEANDLAVFTVTPPTVYEGIPISPDGPEYLTQKIWIPGAGNGQPGTIIGGTVSKVEPMGITWGEHLRDGQIQLDANAHPGNSGCPVVDEQGRVVGVVIEGNVVHGHGHGRIVATESEQLNPLLERHEARAAEGADEVPAVAIDATDADTADGEEVSADETDATDSNWTQVLTGIEGKLAAEVAGDHTPTATLDRLAGEADAQAEIDGTVDGDDLPDLPV